MARQYLQSAAARKGLSPFEIASMPDGEISKIFERMHWGNDGRQVCPSCGAVDHHYQLRQRVGKNGEPLCQKWKCRHCGHVFSVTSGTKFAYRKMPLKKYLYAIGEFAVSVKGNAANELLRQFNADHKSAFVMQHKIREALLEKRSDEKLSGEIHVDGMYVNGTIRPRNKRKYRIDRRAAKNQKPTKRVLMSLCQKVPEGLSGSGIPTGGTFRTISGVLKSENQKEILKFVLEHVELGSIVCADENPAYDALAAYYDLRRVNHKEEYRADDGTTNNLAESYNARVRRGQYGVYHKFGELYLPEYANESAYRQDMRRHSQGKIIDDILRRCLRTRSSRNWCGYWQGNRRRIEVLKYLDTSPKVN